MLFPFFVFWPVSQRGRRSHRHAKRSERHCGSMAAGWWWLWLEQGWSQNPQISGNSGNPGLQRRTGAPLTWLSLNLLQAMTPSIHHLSRGLSCLLGLLRAGGGRGSPQQEDASNFPLGWGVGTSILLKAFPSQSRETWGRDWTRAERPEATANWGWDFPGGATGKEPACQCVRLKRCGFDLWVRKIPLEEGMATNCSNLAWRIPWIGGPGGLWFIASPDILILPDVRCSFFFLLANCI